MSVRPNSGHPADSYSPAANVAGMAGPTLSSYGPEFTLGEIVERENRAADKILYSTDSSGDVIAASKENGTAYAGYAGTDIAIKNYAGTGGQDWILVYASEAISQGDVVVRKLTSLPSGFTVGQAVGAVGATSSAPETVMGVAQHNIASGTYAWILRRGKGYVTADTGITAGQAIIPSGANAGQVDHVAAAGDSSIGYALEASGSSVIKLAQLDCRG